MFSIHVSRLNESGGCTNPNGPHSSVRYVALSGCFAFFSVSSVVSAHLAPVLVLCRLSVPPSIALPLPVPSFCASSLRISDSDTRGNDERTAPIEGRRKFQRQAPLSRCNEPRTPVIFGVVLPLAETISHLLWASHIPNRLRDPRNNSKEKCRTTSSTTSSSRVKEKRKGLRKERTIEIAVASR